MQSVCAIEPPILCSVSSTVYTQAIGGGNKPGGRAPLGQILWRERSERWLRGVGNLYDVHRTPPEGALVNTLLSYPSPPSALCTALWIRFQPISPCTRAFFFSFLILLNSNRAVFNLASALHWGWSFRSRGVSSSARPREYSLKMIRSRSGDNRFTDGLLAFDRPVLLLVILSVVFQIEPDSDDYNAVDRSLSSSSLPRTADGIQNVLCEFLTECKCVNFNQISWLTLQTGFIQANSHWKYLKQYVSWTE